jgi:2-dehydro-3-deoxyphosphogalactonate aldolase
MSMAEQNTKPQPKVPWPKMRRDLIAILRGLQPSEALSIGGALVDTGIEAIEVPLNSPDPFTSIEILAKAFPNCLIGAGTVLTAEDCAKVHDAGGQLMVSPNIDAEVMSEALKRHMVTLPGVFTASEALLALKLGATGLKFFPANVLGPDGIKALSAVLPKDCRIGAVGGVSEVDFAAYGQAGIRMFGLGSSLYKPGLNAKDVAARATKTVAAWDQVFIGEAI